LPGRPANPIGVSPSLKEAEPLRSTVTHKRWLDGGEEHHVRSGERVIHRASDGHHLFVEKKVILNTIETPRGTVINICRTDCREMHVRVKSPAIMEKARYDMVGRYLIDDSICIRNTGLVCIL
jgi:hypothetical protein